jgi:acetolactate decarboxylase
MKHIIYTTILILLAKFTIAQLPLVNYQGKMSKIGQDGRVDSEILVDTIKGSHLYALGPVENLRGEIIVWDSKQWVAALTPEGEPTLLKNVKNLNAIFLVYAQIPIWDTIQLKDKIESLSDLQKSINKAANLHGTDTSSAFPFLLFGTVSKGSGSIMFKDPRITTINTESLKNAKHSNYFSNQQAQMLGFYSQHHQKIFTSTNSFIHIHYRLGNKYQCGHLDEVVFDQSESLQLLLPHQ